MPSIDIIPGVDDENLQTLLHDTQGDTGTPDNPAGDSQPEAQQPARPARDTQGNTGMPDDPADDSTPQPLAPAFLPLTDWTLASPTMTLQFVYEFLQLGGPIVNLILSRFVSERLLDNVVKLRGDGEISWRQSYLQGILGAFVSGVRRSDAAVAYLFELDNIFAVCAMFIIWKDIPRLRLLAQCCPDHPMWTECLQKFDTIPEYFQLELLRYNREEILSTVSDFRALFEGGESEILNSRSTVDSLWRRLRQRHRNIGKELTGAGKV
ncbi:hypothetical protein EDD85DRAFT_953139 [Armillaria nabsnona]|nr:hypothetical protein EDD85DRAFT_953139 [Armillaria nabsnona]